MSYICSYDFEAPHYQGDHLKHRPVPALFPPWVETLEAATKCYPAILIAVCDGCPNQLDGYLAGCCYKVAAVELS